MASGFDGLLTAERERDLRRTHARRHPDGLIPSSGRVCDVCLLLAALKASTRNRPRCAANTARGYRCARGQGHEGAHQHPDPPQWDSAPVSVSGGKETQR